VATRLLNAGYLARRPVRKPLFVWTRGHLNWCDGDWQHVVFSDESRPVRKPLFVWTRGHLNWCDGDWQHVVFSDESRFLLYRQDGRVRVLRQAHDVLLNECVLPRVQASGGRVTVWDASLRRGKSEFHVLDGNMDQY